MGESNAEKSGISKFLNIKTILIVVVGLAAFILVPKLLTGGLGGVKRTSEEHVLKGVVTTVTDGSDVYSVRVNRVVMNYWPEDEDEAKEYKDYVTKSKQLIEVDITVSNNGSDDVYLGYTAFYLDSKDNSEDPIPTTIVVDSEKQFSPEALKTVTLNGKIYFLADASWKLEDLELVMSSIGSLSFKEVGRVALGVDGEEAEADKSVDITGEVDYVFFDNVIGKVLLKSITENDTASANQYVKEGEQVVKIVATITNPTDKERSYFSNDFNLKSMLNQSGVSLFRLTDADDAFGKETLKLAAGESAEAVFYFVTLKGDKDFILLVDELELPIAK